MEVREYRTMDKTEWGEGPWQTELDKRQWPDEDTGLPCVIIRHPFLGNLCGYVGVPPSHPAYGKDRKHGLLRRLQAHGGVNFASPCQDVPDEAVGVCHVPAPGEPDTVWWLGFDCSHVFDLSPRQDAVMRPVFDSMPGFMRPENSPLKPVYRDWAYVEENCRGLAAQLAVIGRGEKLPPSPGALAAVALRQYLRAAR